MATDTHGLQDHERSTATAAPWEYVTCPACGDDILLPTTRAGQADALRAMAHEFIEHAAKIERGDAGLLGSYGSQLDWREWMDDA